MRSPARVLNSLTKHSQTTEYRFERLYRILFNEEMYYLAYQRIYAKPGNMTQGADGKTIDRMSLSRIEKLIVERRKLLTPAIEKNVHPEEKRKDTTSRRTLFRRQTGAGGSTNGTGSYLRRSL
mgnify:CR=1 FL=1